MFSKQERGRTYCPRGVGEFTDILSAKPKKCEVLVGYHGSCSPSKSSLESEIEVDLENGLSGQLGKKRFYTSDTAYSAYLFGQAACNRYMEGKEETETSDDIQPIVCSIYADVSALPKLPKVFIPMYASLGTEGQGSQTAAKTLLHYNEQAIEQYESTVRENADLTRSMSHLDPIRISKSNVVNRGLDTEETTDQTKKSMTTDITAGWSEEAVFASKLRAVCAVVKPDSKYKLNQLQSAKLNKVLMFPTSESVKRVWGVIDGAEEYFKV